MNEWESEKTGICKDDVYEQEQMETLEGMPGNSPQDISTYINKSLL